MQELKPLDSTQLQIVACNNLFSSNRLKERCLQHTNAVYTDTYENRKVRKAFCNQIFAILRAEIDYVKKHIRIYQKNKKPRVVPRVKSKRRPTAYSEFCRYMRDTRPHKEIAGKLQMMWKQSRGLPVKERKREVYTEKQKAKPAPEESDSEDEDDTEEEKETEASTPFANVVYEQDTDEEEEEEQES
jgi:hypothetical protein